MLTSLFVLALIAGIFWLLCQQTSISVWLISYLIVSALYVKFTHPGYFMMFILCALAVPLLIGSIKPLRQKLISQKILGFIKKNIPNMSATEQEALDAGTVGWEGDLFSGTPDFDKLLKVPAPKLTVEEQAFLDGPVNELCRMINDWEISHERADLSPAMWEYIKSKGFWGMIIPKQYGGLDFSATAQAMVLAKICTSSISAAITVSVPNSLGPAELLLKYGTQAQKDFYLPRLANGQEIPCFALTGPQAGSDAASIPDHGFVCRERVDGKEVIGMRLTWNKRYITLCPVATVLGLAFKLYDPENILGKGEELGISCALIPTSTPGVIHGRRHFPLNAAFQNGPTQGTNVFVPIDYLIGGPEMAGKGWRMLMECLSAGRAISLPCSAMGGSQAATLASSAYAKVRKQFGLPIAAFEGIADPLARIGASTYMINAGVFLTSVMIDEGAKPSVAGAILKYHTTERARNIAIDAMDIHGGKGICLGPKNYLGRAYQMAPISITVEGANILTRSLIIFGQGVIRSHPYIYQEMTSAREGDLVKFDKVFWSHAGFILSNFAKSLIFNFTDGHLLKAPQSSVKRSYQLITRYSANLAFLSDFCMAIMGGALKRKEKISARLGDIVSQLYLLSAVLKKFHDDKEPEADLPVVQWCSTQLLWECEQAINGVIDNFPTSWGRVLLRLLVKPLKTQRTKPSDRLSNKVAKLLTAANETRDRLTFLVFKEPLENCPLGKLEEAFTKINAIVELEKRVNHAAKAKTIKGFTFLELIDAALINNIISETEAGQLKDAEQARQGVIAVDDFAKEDLIHNKDDVTNIEVKRQKRKQPTMIDE